MQFLSTFIQGQLQQYAIQQREEESQREIGDRRVFVLALCVLCAALLANVVTGLLLARYTTWDQSSLWTLLGSVDAVMLSTIVALILKFGRRELVACLRRWCCRQPPPTPEEEYRRHHPEEFL